ncbi:MAG: 4-hydroxy-tetrahydrodipicolinate reductase [Chlamydiales bacterium]
MILLGILGATGKMGRAVLQAAARDKDVKIVGGCASPHSSHLGKDLGLLVGEQPTHTLLSQLVDAFAEECDVLIDFSSTAAANSYVQAALKYGKPLVIGTTGHSTETHLNFEIAAKQIPIFYAPNFSLGMALCIEASGFFARHLKGSCHVDILETHHTQKKDAPSGSALALAKSLDFGGIYPGTLVESPRSKEAVAIHSLRRGSVVGEHEVIFECEGERLTLKHEVLSRETFAKGGLKAAKFLASASPGLYSIKDLLHK